MGIDTIKHHNNIKTQKYPGTNLFYQPFTCTSIRHIRSNKSQLTRNPIVPATHANEYTILNEKFCWQYPVGENLFPSYPSDDLVITDRKTWKFIFLNIFIVGISWRVKCTHIFTCVVFECKSCYFGLKRRLNRSYGHAFVSFMVNCFFGEYYERKSGEIDGL